MNLEKRLPFLCLFLAAAGFACLYPLQTRLDATFGESRSLEEAMYISSGKTVKNLSFGFDGVVADLYWMRSIQYFGMKSLNSIDGKRKITGPVTAKDIPLLYPLLDVTTTIDPDYTAAYRTGSLLLSEYDFEGGVNILKKGLSQTQDRRLRFRLWFDLGSLYWRAKRYEECANAYDEAAKLAGTESERNNSVLMAGAAKTKGGDRKTSYLLFSQLLKEAEDEKARLSAVWRLEQLQSMDERDFLLEQIKEFEKRTGRRPDSLSQIFPLIVENQKKAIDTLGRPLPFVTDPDRHFDADRVPLDPTGTPYRYDRERNCIGLSQNSTISRDINEQCK
jgi:tetratricopeptide (TPR) repeat protein